jgi:shikimate kinase
MGQSLSIHRPLFLVGNRGTGKTTVAEVLAARLGWSWLDADALLETRVGRSIREIFAEQGEQAFRDLESAILSELCGHSRYVIATGGGVVLRPENRQLLIQSGTVIWLTGDPSTLWQRMQMDGSTGERRPDLTVGGLEEVDALVKARAPLYAECTVVAVDTVGRTPSEIADAIMEILPVATGPKR